MVDSTGYYFVGFFLMYDPSSSLKDCTVKNDFLLKDFVLLNNIFKKFQEVLGIWKEGKRQVPHQPE